MPDRTLSPGEAARRLGVAVTTLRTWHRRYGLGPSHHEAGRHRRYTRDDLARLDAMRRLTAQGVPAAQAAQAARAVTPDGRGPTSDGRGPAGDGRGPAGDGNAPAGDGHGPAGDGHGPAGDGHGPAGDGRGPAGDGSGPADAGRRADSGRQVGARDGGGHTIPVGRAGPAARGLARAAVRLDQAAMRETIAAALAADGVVRTWNALLRPVLGGIGHRHAATSAMVEVEHLLSRCITEALATVPRPRHRPATVLLACADEEQHSLPLEALAAALAERGVPSRLLGARVPPRALLAAAGRTGPRAVVLWSHTPATADPAPLLALLDHRPVPLVLIAAGPGWRAGRLPPQVHAPTSLDGALRLLTGGVLAGEATT